MAALIIDSMGASAHDTSADNDWPGYGRTQDQSHYSPLSDINISNVHRLGLAWWFDIPGVVRATSVPLEVAGRLYFATGYSVVRAVDATNGHLLWTYDPEVYKFGAEKLGRGFGIRGIAYWNNKVYVGTQDGRLVSIHADSGKPLWSVLTTEPGDLRVITGPPVAFHGKVIIGHGGAEFGPVRGYVTCYDAETGKRLWRFFTVPGDPRNGFENEAMRMAARTWTGEWWKFGGGGGTVWNAITYDQEMNRIYIGTSNGSPWNRKIRSPQGGDNLFITSIVALDAETGTYIWHYQTTPGDTWDYDAVQDIELADLVIDGKRRRVLMQASKNGFFYVIDRELGQLVSATKFAKVTWAEKVDTRTGRPVETANARYQSGEATVWPGPNGAHGLPPMAFNTKETLVYIPVVELPGYYNDKGIDFLSWKPDPKLLGNLGLNFNFNFAPDESSQQTGGSLLAWNPVTQRAVWQVSLPGAWNGGIATTAGGLVFQGAYDGKFSAYDAGTGKNLWSFDAQVGIIGAPITYKIQNRQFLSVITGFAGQESALGSAWDARTQRRRVLTFTLDGNAHLPPAPAPRRVTPMQDPTFAPDPDRQDTGARWFVNRCAPCHGYGAVGGGAAPDLRGSPLILLPSAFSDIVKHGTLASKGMPRFSELSDETTEDIRQYLRWRATEMRKNDSPSTTLPKY